MSSGNKYRICFRVRPGAPVRRGVSILDERDALHILRTLTEADRGEMQIWLEKVRRVGNGRCE